MSDVHACSPNSFRHKVDNGCKSDNDLQKSKDSVRREYKVDRAPISAREVDPSRFNAIN